MVQIEDVTLERWVFLFFLKELAACGILIPQPGIGTASPAAETWSLKPWITREVQKPQRSVSYRLLGSFGRNEPVL